MKRNLLIHIFLIFLILFSTELVAVPAVPYPITLTQPDGSRLTVRLKGDEFFHYHTTEDGFLIKKNTDGVFNYAELDIVGNPIITPIKARNLGYRTDAEKRFLKTQRPNPNVSRLNSMARMRRSVPTSGMSKSPSSSMEATAANQFPRNGSPRTLVILVNFADVSFITPNPNTAFTNLLNEESYSANGGTGSAKDYFKDNSMGLFTPHFDVVGPFNLPNPVKFYGENDANGDDKNIIQMVIDACKAASNNGVDFSDYDEDNNNIIDNIFIYYAGHNEAEGAPADRVWPHRWEIHSGNYSGPISGITFNGKKIKDYACTSELRGRSGTNMAGIGTFTHEFGHVLGLADLYPTDGASHFTLSDWSIMDYGAYLNEGRTPPAYNAFERFQLGYLTPIILKNPEDIDLPSLIDSNTAYLIHNDSLANFRMNPFATQEYFLLENRQKKSWDTYLPGHGMLIYRINFNKNDWDDNTFNNNPSKMGIELIAADGIATERTLSGDPFPGTSNSTIFTPRLNSKQYLLKQPLIGINENNELISFKYKGGVLDSPIATAASDITYKDFTANWEQIPGASGYYVSVSQINKDGTSTLAVDDQWTTSTNMSIYNLISDYNYSFRVKGSYKNEHPPYELVTGYSNGIDLKTLPYLSKSELRIVPIGNNSIEVFPPEEEIGSGEIMVFNSIGQKIKTVNASDYIVVLNDLPKNVVLIIQVGKHRTKVIVGE